MKIRQFIATLATIFIYVFCSAISFAQMSMEQRNLKVDILRLREYSIAYDANRIAENPDKGKREMIIKKYKDQINLIKNGPDRERYIKFLSNAVGVDSSKYAKEIGYNYKLWNSPCFW
ncbi:MULTISPECIES: hypothetical protein [Sphingobacterium]|uniref:hypothetical protein n=1 Tax=Sphingobacterium TaxID=28453 RepID=UPI0013DAB5BD|nr:MULTISPECIES: hypothetical protein [unclassified Sphingobacterium]